MAGSIQNESTTANLVVSEGTPVAPSSAAPELSAWLLPISSTQSVAVGCYELKYIEYVDAVVSLPGLPAFCEKGFMWRDRFIPALDVWSLSTRRRMQNQSSEHLAAIIVYENAQGDLAVGAILLAGVPKLVAVAPAQSVAVTELKQEWQQLAHAAFKDERTVYPVLNLRCLFDNTPTDLLSLH